MKKILLTIAISFLATSMLVCCKDDSPEAKAKKMIKQKLERTLDDWSSYESVYFSSLDSIFTTVDEDSTVKVYEDKISLLEDSKPPVRVSLFDSPKRANDDRIQQINDSIDILRDSLKIAVAKFKPQFKGYKMEHDFRTKTTLGNKVMNNKIYEFDANLNEITGGWDVESYNIYQQIRHELLNSYK